MTKGSHVDIWRKLFQKHEISKFEGPEAAKCQAFWRIRNISLGAANWRGILTEHENREVRVGQGRADHVGLVGYYKNQDAVQTELTEKYHDMTTKVQHNTYS